MTCSRSGWVRIRASPAGPIEPAPEMLVPIEARAERRLRVVEVDHRQALEADPVVELADDPVDALGPCRSGGPRPTGGPCPGRSRPAPRPRRGPRAASSRRPSSPTSTPSPPPPPAEFSRTSSAGCRDRRRRPGPAAAAIPVGRPGRSRRRVRWPLCEPVWTLTKRAPKLGATVSSWARTSIDFT